MTSIEAAARTLAEAEAQRARAEAILRAVVGTYDQAQEAHQHATAAVAEAMAQLVVAIHPPVEEKVVKRPAATSDTLLDLDDVGGR